jgi:hypothetical protein
MTNTLGDNALSFRDGFRSALGGISKSTQIRFENAGLIPPPDAYVGRRPAWRIASIRATVEKFAREGAANRPKCDTPRSPGRPKKAPKPLEQIGG